MTERFTLIADGGSTKVRWQIRGLGNQVAGEFVSPGMNPSVMGEDALRALLAEFFTASVGDTHLEGIRYFGAGCAGAGIGLMRGLLAEVSGLARERIVVDSDMLGAAEGLLGHSAGVACIIGTGANSCLYNGERIVANTPPLGYILGDEGSGAWIGRNLVADYLKGLMPREVAVAFDSAFGFTKEEVVGRVYRPQQGDMPANRFLASLAPFASEHMAHRYVRELIEQGFREFLRRNVARYLHPDLLRQAGIADSRELTLNFTGGVAFAFREQLRRAVEAERLRMGVVKREPLSL